MQKIEMDIERAELRSANWSAIPHRDYSPSINKRQEGCIHKENRNSIHAMERA
jgi:hypothetical protein